jgi:hypothetical protein
VRLVNERGKPAEHRKGIQGNAAFGKTSNESVDRALEADFAMGAVGERSDFAAEVVLAGSARAEGAVVEAETVKFGASDHAAMAAVGESEPAERRRRGVITP